MDNGNNYHHSSMILSTPASSTGPSSSRRRSSSMNLLFAMMPPDNGQSVNSSILGQYTDHGSTTNSVFFSSDAGDTSTVIDILRKHNKPSTYPKLKWDDLFSCLQDLGIVNLTKEDINSPQKGKVREFFLTMLQILAGVTEHDLKARSGVLAKTAVDQFGTVQLQPSTQNDQGGSENEDNMNIRHQHDKSTFSDMLFYVEVRKLMNVALYQDFSIRDLTNPNHKRFKAQIEALLNLAKFYHSEDEKYSDREHTRGELVEHLMGIQDDSEGVNEEFQALKKALEETLHQREEIDRQMKDLEKEHSELKTLVEESRSKQEELEKMVKDKKREVENSKITLHQTEKEYKGLLPKFVENPEEIKNRLASAKVENELRKKTSKDLEKQVQESKEKLQRLEQMIKSFVDVKQRLQDYMEKVSEFKKKVHDLESTAHHIREEEGLVSTIIGETQTLERKWKEMNCQLDTEREQHKIEIKGLEEKLDDSKTRLSQAEQEKREAVAYLESCEEKIRTLKQQMESEHEAAQKEIRDAWKEFEVIQENFFEIHEQHMERIKLADQAAGASTDDNEIDRGADDSVKK